MTRKCFMSKCVTSHCSATAFRCFYVVLSKQQALGKPISSLTVRLAIVSFAIPCTTEGKYSKLCKPSYHGRELYDLLLTFDGLTFDGLGLDFWKGTL